MLLKYFLYKNVVDFCLSNIFYARLARFIGRDQWEYYQSGLAYDKSLYGRKVSARNGLTDQCTQIGQLLKFSATKFLTKVAQIDCDFLGHLKNITILV